MFVFQITVITMITILVLTVLASCSEALDTNYPAEIERANLQSQELVEELSDLWRKIDENKVNVDEKIFAVIVERIQEIAEAKEEDNLIRLSEKVKSARLGEDQLQQSVTELENFISELSAGEETG